MHVDRLWPSARTETWIQAPSRVYEDHGDVGAFRTVSNPTYRWGNCLVLPSPPTAADLPSLETRHRGCFPDAEQLGQVPAFYWPDQAPSPDLSAALEARGYRVEAEAPLQTTERQRACLPPPQGIDVAPVRSASDWRALVSFRMDIAPQLPGDFLLHRLADAWKTAQVLDGDWWVVRDQGEVCGSMGLFWRDGLARYQDVDIHPDRQGRGLGRLLFQTVRARSEASGAFSAQIIVADRGSLAHDWYQRMGFSPIQGEVFAYIDS